MKRFGLVTLITLALLASACAATEPGGSARAKTPAEQAEQDERDRKLAEFEYRLNRAVEAGQITQAQAVIKLQEYREHLATESE